MTGPPRYRAIVVANLIAQPFTPVKARASPARGCSVAGTGERANPYIAARAPVAQSRMAYDVDSLGHRN
jgi:hypothetical protein